MFKEIQYNKMLSWIIKHNQESFNKYWKLTPYLLDFFSQYTKIEMYYNFRIIVWLFHMFFLFIFASIFGRVYEAQLELKLK